MSNDTAMAAAEQDVHVASLVRWLDELSVTDTPTVGGKNSSLGELFRHLRASGVRVPDGFATTATAYRQFLAENGLDERIRWLLAERANGRASLRETGAKIRDAAGARMGRIGEIIADLSIDHEE